MYTSTFTFARPDFDDDFHERDQAIAKAARSIAGYLGEEAFENPATGVVSNVYYWETLDALQALMQHPDHVAAKHRQSRWLNGYQVVIAQVIACYGDGGLEHPLATRSLALPVASGPAPSRVIPDQRCS